jgi:signal peptidase II
MTEFLYDWFGLNTWLFKLINGLPGTPAYYDTMLTLSAFGEHRNFKFYFLFVLMLWLREIGIQKYKHKQPITRVQIRQEVAVFSALVMGFLLSGLVVGVLKSFIPAPRPFNIPDIRAIIHFAGPYPNEADYNASFPSGHAAMMTFIVAVMWHKLSHPLYHYLGVIFILLVGWSRIAIGMHFPADVVGGVLIGLGVAYVIRRYVYRALNMPVPGKIVEDASPPFQTVEAVQGSPPIKSRRIWNLLK